jgi:hypothetical protein
MPQRMAGADRLITVDDARAAHRPSGQTWADLGMTWG